MGEIARAESGQQVVVGAGRFRYRVEESWDRFPANGPHGEAVAVACDSRDRVYLFLRGPEPVRIHEPDGTLVKCWGSGQFVRPHGLTLGPNNTAYFTDDFGHSVRAFTSDGQPLLTLGTPGCPSETGATSVDYRTIQRAGPPFHYPTNLAIAPSGELYISDGYGNARVHRFTAQGRLLQSWGEPGAGPGQFQVPHGIAVDGQGVVYVADRENSRIQLFEGDGRFRGQWTNVARPSHLAIDREGWIYIAELGFRAGRWPGTGPPEPGAVGGRISIFDREGTLHARWGSGDAPCAPGDFFAPHGIAVDSRGDLYVTEVAWSAGGRDGLVPPSCHTVQKFVRLRTP